MECLRNWLSTPMDLAVRAERGNTLAITHIDFHNEEAVKFHYFYKDGCSLCIKLNPDGTWQYYLNDTTGQCRAVI